MAEKYDPQYPDGMHPGLIRGISVEEQRYEFGVDKVVFGVAAALILAFIGCKLIVHAVEANTLPFINGGEPITVIPEASRAGFSRAIAAKSAPGARTFAAMASARALAASRAPASPPSASADRCWPRTDSRPGVRAAGPRR